MKKFSDHLQKYNIYLASRSPRRRDLLTQAGIPFKLWLKEEQDEVFPDHLNPGEVAFYLARMKAIAYLDELADSDILITADTLVVIDNSILGKPADRNQAIGMLEKLAGDVHEVITGVCLSSRWKESVFISRTKVWFDHLDKEEIMDYVDRFSPFDKAGSYGIQEWIGYRAINRIEGSYFNVMGLPVQQLYCELQEITGYKSTISK